MMKLSGKMFIDGQPVGEGTMEIDTTPLADQLNAYLDSVYAQGLVVYTIYMPRENAQRLRDELNYCMQQPFSPDDMMLTYQGIPLEIEP